MSALEIPTLETKRLRLRGIRKDDFEDYAALYSDPEVVRFINNGELWDRARAWRHMAFAVGHWQLQGVGVWTVEERASGAFVGMIGFWEPVAWPGFELSVHLARRFWRHGYASEGAREAMAHAFNVLKKETIISLVNPKNLASIRLVERIGETLRCRIEHYGRQTLCFGLDRETYRREVAMADLTVRCDR
jgi:RimJ/RimL family protein N-acetyltransferase